MLELHTVSIVIHALSATGAFIVGIVLLFQNNTHQQLQLARAVVVLLMLMEVFLFIAIISHVNSLPAITQIIFLGLAVLGLYMIWRAVQAVSVLQAQPSDQVAVIGHIGFILISLFDGFAIVTATDLQAPGWLVAFVAVGAIALGIYAINARKKTLPIQSRQVEMQDDQQEMPIQEEARSMIRMNEQQHLIREEFYITSDPGIQIFVREVQDGETPHRPKGPILLLHGARIPGVAFFDLYWLLVISVLE